MQHPNDAPFSSLSRMGGMLADFERDRFFITKNGAVELDRLREHLADRQGPWTLFGTALAFLNLLEVSPDLHLELPAGSVLIETGGFKGRDVISANSPSTSSYRSDLASDSTRFGTNTE